MSRPTVRRSPRRLLHLTLVVAFVLSMVLGAIPAQAADFNDDYNSVYVNRSNCEINGQIFPLHVTSNGLVLGQNLENDPVLLSQIKTYRSKCYVDFKKPMSFWVDISQGTLSVDSHGVALDKSVRTGTRLYFEQNKERNGAAGFLLTIVFGAGSPAPAQPAPLSPAPPVGNVLPAGSCDIGGNPANRKHLEPAKNGTQYWMPWVAELKQHGGPCAFNTGSYSGTIEVVDGPHKVGQNHPFHKTFAAGDQSAGFGFNLDSGQAVPVPGQAQPAPAAAAAPASDPWNITPTDERGSFHGSCTMPNTGFKAMLVGEGGTRLYQDPWVKALKSEGGQCAVFSGHRGGVVKIMGKDIPVPAYHVMYVEVQPSEGAGFIFITR